MAIWSDCESPLWPPVPVVGVVMVILPLPLFCVLPLPAVLLFPSLLFVCLSVNQLDETSRGICWWVCEAVSGRY